MVGLDGSGAEADQGEEACRVRARTGANRGPYNNCMAIVNRRSFLSASALAASRVLGANERVRGAVIGSGGRGRLLTSEFKEIGVEMGAVCDIYEPNLQAGLKVASSGARGYDDYRRMLEDKSIDVVVVATPDHWHAQNTIDAVDAGKDVYVEKPLAHTIEDGFRMVAAARRTKRIVQVGTQRRSYDLFLDAKRVRETADMGSVHLVNAWWYNRQDSLRKANIEGKIDWAQWLGPAPKREVDATRFFNWYYYWDYSGGLMVGQAAHAIDAIQWFEDRQYPLAVYASGGEPNLKPAEIPTNTSMSIEFPGNLLVVFTVGYQTMRYASHIDQMKQFLGTKARFDVGRESYALYPENPKATRLEPTVQEARPGTFGAATRMHIRNFLDCVRSRKDPNATVEMGQYTNVVMCMAIESLRTKRRVTYDERARRMV